MLELVQPHLPIKHAHDFRSKEILILSGNFVRLLHIPIVLFRLQYSSGKILDIPQLDILYLFILKSELKK